MGESVEEETHLDFNDITKNFQQTHNINAKCRCKKKLTDFLCHIPTQDTGHNLLTHAQQVKIATQNLLFDSADNDNTPKSEAQIKAHFLILALRFHPDKNDQKLEEQCKAIMQILNESYMLLIEDTTRTTSNVDIAYRDGHRYTKSSPNVVACEFASEFSIYSNKPLEKLWLQELETYFSKKPATLKNNKGSMFGDPKNSLHVSVFHNGTVLCQGVMALTFGIDTIQTIMLPNILKLAHQQNLKLTNNTRSEKLKTALKLFENSKKSDDNSVTLQLCSSKKQKPMTDLFNDKQIEEQEYCSSCITCTQKLEALALKLEQANERAERLQKLVDKVLNSQKQAESTLGPRLSDIIARVISLEQRSLPVAPAQTMNQAAAQSQNTPQINHTAQIEQPDPHKTPAANLLAAEQQSTEHVNTPDPNPNNWSTVTKRHRPEKTAIKNQNKETGVNAHLKHGRKPMDFLPEQCILIHGVNKLVKHDKYIRQAVARSYQQAIVEWIKNYSEFEPKYLVQLAKPEMVKNVIENWPVDNLGGAKVRGLSAHKTNGSQTNIGFAKHVDKELTDEELNASVHSTFPEAKCQRLRKDGTILNTVKIIFKTQQDLSKATEFGIFIGHYAVKVEPEKPTVRYVQCRNCWSFGHVKKFCPHDKRCSHCGNAAQHEHCDLVQECCNCGGSHSSKNWNECETFQSYARYKQKKHSLRQWSTE